MLYLLLVLVLVALVVATSLTQHTVNNMNAISPDVVARIMVMHPIDERRQTLDYLQCLVDNIQSRLLLPAYDTVDLDRLLLDRLTKTVSAIVTQPDEPVSLALLFG